MGAGFLRKTVRVGRLATSMERFDPSIRDPRVDAVTRHAGSEPLRILELGTGTGTTAAALAVAGHDVVAIENQDELAA